MAYTTYLYLFMVIIWFGGWSIFVIPTLLHLVALFAWELGLQYLVVLFVMFFGRLPQLSRFFAEDTTRITYLFPVLQRVPCWLRSVLFSNVHKTRLQKITHEWWLTQICWPLVATMLSTKRAVFVMACLCLCQLFMSSPIMFTAVAFLFCQHPLYQYQCQYVVNALASQSPRVNITPSSDMLIVIP